PSLTHFRFQLYLARAVAKNDRAGQSGIVRRKQHGPHAQRYVRAVWAFEHDILDLAALVLRTHERTVSSDLAFACTSGSGEERWAELANERTIDLAEHALRRIVHFQHFASVVQKQDAFLQAVQ